MRYYAIVGASLFEADETDKGPDSGWIEMSGPRPDSTDYTAQENGSWAITPETVKLKQAVIELEWRDIEMPKAQQSVTALQYGEEGIPGTAQQWQKYWLALRKWNDTNPDFPDSTKRPVAPT